MTGGGIVGDPPRQGAEMPPSPPWLLSLCTQPFGWIKGSGQHLEVGWGGGLILGQLSAEQLSP